MRSRIVIFIAVLLAVFGFITLFMSTAVIFDLFGIREKEGNYVPFVVGSNFIASLLYLPAAFGLFKRKNWSVMLLMIAVVLLTLTFVALLFHIKAGGIYETKTIAALLFRILITVVVMLTGSRMISGIRNKQIRPISN